MFLELVELLQPTGVQLPARLLQSPHLAMQREKRGRKRRRRRPGKEEEKSFYDQ